MSEKDGGTAFPSHEHFIADRENGGERQIITGKPQGGMSLRDYFAAHAPMKIEEWPLSGITLEIAVGRAYRWADAMLKERSK